jgi:hypothetical protein
VDEDLIGIEQIFTIEVIDNDNSPMSSTLSVSITIADDDTDAPIIHFDLIITVDGSIMCEFNATDESGIPLEDLRVFVDGNEQTILGTHQDGDIYYLDFTNAFSNGIHTVDVIVSDGDNDRADDSMSITISGTFEIIGGEDDPIELIDNLIDYINENIDCRLARRIINHKLRKAKRFIIDGKIDQAEHFLDKAEFFTILFEWFGIIDQPTADYIITQIEYIRTLI